MRDQDHFHQGECYCGAVSVRVRGEPVFTAYCHCKSCRKWHSAPIAALAGWPTEDVIIEGETVQSSTNDQTLRTSCIKCGGGILTAKPGLGLIVVYPSILSDSGFAYRPAAHIFYGERVMDVSDGLAKFRDLPKESGGSGALIANPDTTEWRL